MNSLKKLNSYSLGFKSVSELEENKLYKVEKMRTIGTKYGISILVNLTDIGDVILPSRFRDLCETLEEMNKTFVEKNVFLKPLPAIGKYIPIEFIEEQ